MATSEDRALRFAPWTSNIELQFYQSLAHLKINHDKLDSSARKVLGLYEIRPHEPEERSSHMQIHGTALTSDDTPLSSYRAEGIIRNFNTYEEYKAVDKSSHIARSGTTIWDAINDGTIYSCPSLLSSFSAVCYADLKKYKFSYHFAYPALHSTPSWRLSAPAESAISQFSPKETESLVDKVQTWRYSVDARQRGFFLAKRVPKSSADSSEAPQSPKDDYTFQVESPADQLPHDWVVGSLVDYERGFFDNVEPQDRYIAFADPSTYKNNPGWPLRNLLVLMKQRWKLDRAQILCYRDTHSRREIPSSIVLGIECLQEPNPADPETKRSQVPNTSPKEPLTTRLSMRPHSPNPSTPSPMSIPPAERGSVPKITGWERSPEHNKIVPRTVDLSAYMDPVRLADQAVDLNLRLIKWRIAPSIDLDIVKQTSCLLLGAGTLGSYVARNLMGWGVRKITFVDNARVSYSNPVRQPLFTFENCKNGGALKAKRAAEALKEIYPGVESEGHVMSVPMAGHPIMDDAKVKAEYEKLYQLIKEHDAIFLLMDTRESRWLPTVMAKAAGKIVINAALGFDTYMVMRHGVKTPASATPDEKLSCYFCSDVVAPADSLKSATLDQQCTVTRPGVAPLASSLAVELLVSILQHPLRARCPAPDPSAPTPDTDSHPLGTVPHQLRGFLSNWSTMTIKGHAYDKCSACSPTILDEYEKNGWDFVKRAVNEQGYVEEVSGLAEVQRQAELANDDVDFPSDDEDGDGELL